MEAKIEARVRRTSPTRGKASVHIVFDKASGMTISNMEVWEEDGKHTVKMPPPGRRPDVTFQGDIKRQIELSDSQQFQTAAYSPARTAWR